MFTVRASSAFDKVQKRIEERRAVLESSRTMNVKRLQGDVQRIAKRELEFTKKLLDEFVPVRLIWNEEAVVKMQEAMPFRVEVVNSSKEEEAPSKKTMDDNQ